MVNPAFYSLQIIRGIDFQSVIFQCKDAAVTVSGTLTPNVAGVYTPNGTFNGYPLFILTGAPSTFIYFHPIALTYIISQTLSTGAFTDYWLPTPALTEPTGTYNPQGAALGVATASDHPIDLTGFTAEARIRRTPNSEQLLDFLPTVTDPINGEITIPGMTKAQTLAIGVTGNFMWDLVLVDNTLERFGPFITGPVTISDNITQAP